MTSENTAVFLFARFLNDLSMSNGCGNLSYCRTLCIKVWGGRGEQLSGARDCFFQYNI